MRSKGWILMWLGVLPAALACGAGAESAVGVSSVTLRGRPSVFGAAGAHLAYGTKVTVLAKQDGWSQVSDGKATGWVSDSALGDARSILRDVGKGEKVTTDSYQSDVALAGKGISEESEAEFRKENPKVDFGAIDRMERDSVPMDASFAIQGKLHPEKETP